VEHVNAYEQLAKFREQRGHAHALPSVYRAALPYAILVPLPALAIATGLVGWPFAVAVCVSIAIAGLARVCIVASQLAAARAKVDTWIRLHPASAPRSAAIAQRMEELVSPRKRKMLASSLRRAVKCAAKPPAISASVLNYPAVRAQSSLVLALADRLGDLERGAHPHGVLLALDLLTQGGSPFYNPTRAHELAATLQRALDSLEVAH